MAMIGDWGTDLPTTYKSPPAPKPKAPAPRTPKQIQTEIDRMQGQADYHWPVIKVTNPGGAPTGTPPPPPPKDTGPSLADLQREQQARDAAAEAKRNAEGKASSKKQNDATKEQAQKEFGKLAGFEKQRDTKLGNLDKALTESLKVLMESYSKNAGSLKGSLSDNEKAEADGSFASVTNAVRERGDILSEAANQGAGESDLLRSQLMAIRNYASNKGEIARSYFDTRQSINSSGTAMTADTATSRAGLYNQRESDRESTWADFYNQRGDTWNQIANIENSNTNTDSDSSEAYKKIYGNAPDKVAEYAGMSYARKDMPKDWNQWNGQWKNDTRSLTASNRAATVSLGAQKKPEGATLRKW